MWCGPARGRGLAPSERGPRRYDSGSTMLGMLLESAGGGAGQATVTELVPGLPAASCGLITVGDALLAVDGFSVEGWPLQQVRGGLGAEPASG